MMKEMLVIEKYRQDADLILHGLKQQNEDILIYAEVLEGPDSIVRYLGSGHSTFDMLVINIEDKDSNDIPWNHLSQIRKSLKKDSSYILAWVNPLGFLPTWDFEFGKGSFAKKPVDPKEMNDIIQRILQTL